VLAWCERKERARPPQARKRSERLAVVLVGRELQSPRRPTLPVLAGNRFEGHPPGTIKAIAAAIGIAD
jgi:hypothetical protein